MHIFHKWKTRVYESISSGRGWFKHQQCAKCGVERVIDHLDFFSTLSDAIELGCAEGIYKGLRGIK